MTNSGWRRSLKNFFRQGSHEGHLNVTDINPRRRSILGVLTTSDQESSQFEVVGCSGADQSGRGLGPTVKTLSLRRSNDLVPDPAIWGTGLSFSTSAGSSVSASEVTLRKSRSNRQTELSVESESSSRGNDKDDNDEDDSDDDFDDDSDDEEANDLDEQKYTLNAMSAASLASSTLTLKIDGSELLEEDSVPGRLARIFSEDLQEIVSLVEGMPDNERKLVFLREVIHSLRSLRTAATLNSHFIALSSLCAVSLKQV